MIEEPGNWNGSTDDLFIGDLKIYQDSHETLTVVNESLTIINSR